MNKKALVDAVAKKTGETMKLTEEFINAFVDVVEESLEKGEEVRLVGFGTFKVHSKKERKGINPKTMKPMDIPAHKVPKFIPGKTLKDMVDK